MGGLPNLLSTPSMTVPFRLRSVEESVFENERLISVPYLAGN